MKNIEWPLTPPPGVSYQTHKFSLLDAIELASVGLGTDRATEAEFVVVGEYVRALIVVLPHMVPSKLTEAGTLPIHNGRPLIGTMGHRLYYWTGLAEMHLKAEVSNGRASASVTVRLPDNPPA